MTQSYSFAEIARLPDRRENVDLAYSGRKPIQSHDLILVLQLVAESDR